MPSSLDEYELLCTIGSGSYGTCKKIKRKKDGKILVWKELDYGTMTETEKQMLVSEVNLLRELKHQHIVRYYDRIIDRSNTTLYIIMEYCEGGDLATYISKMKREGRHVDEAFVWKIGHQVSQALKECHSRSKNGKAVLHRDLKPANVFLDSENNVKLGDFGLARVLNHDTSFAKTFVGTPYYMSPEQMNYLSYNEKSDIWSLGCLLYELCALRPPFLASNQRELASRICTGRFVRILSRYSSDLNELIACMLEVDEVKRPTIEKLVKHPLLVKRFDRATEVSPREKRPSSAADEGYSSKYESLRRKEEQLKEKEETLLSREKSLIDREDAIKKKENDLQVRERTLVLREKLAAEERLSRTEKMIKDMSLAKPKCDVTAASPRETDDKPSTPSSVTSSTYSRRSRVLQSNCTDSDSSVPSDSPSISEPLFHGSCRLHKQLRPLDSPKKKVHFTEKENVHRRARSSVAVKSPRSSPRDVIAIQKELDLEHLKHLREMRGLSGRGYIGDRGRGMGEGLTRGLGLGLPLRGIGDGALDTRGAGITSKPSLGLKFHSRNLLGLR